MDTWDATPQKFVQIRRRFMLLGQTLDGMRVWDIRRALQTLRSVGEFKDLPIVVESAGFEGVNALYAALDAPGLKGMRLTAVPSSHMRGPDYLELVPKATDSGKAECYKYTAML